MDLIVTDVKLQYGLMLWEDRYHIINQVEKNGSAKLYVDCNSRCECGGKEKFPFKISTQSLVKNNRTIQLISRYESGPKAIFRITKIELVVKGYKTPGHRRFFELTLEKPLKIRKKSKKS